MNEGWKQPGEVLRLPDDIGEIPAGMYVILEVGWMITLSRLGENEDGDMASTFRTFKVTHDEFEQFKPMHLTLDLFTEEA